MFLLAEMTEFNFEQSFISTLKACKFSYLDACWEYREFVRETFDVATPPEPQAKPPSTHSQIMARIEAYIEQSRQLQIAF